MKTKNQELGLHFSLIFKFFMVRLIALDRRMIFSQQGFTFTFN